MRKLGEYIFRGRVQAVGITSLFTVCGLVVPLLTYLCSGLVPGLVTLRKGPVAGIQVIGGSLALTTVVAMFAHITPYLMVALALGIWVPTWFCALVLRQTHEQGKMLLAAGLCGLVYLALSHLLLDDVVQWWKTLLQLWVEQALAPEIAGKYAERLVELAPLMNAMTNAGLVISLVTTLLCSRWWQASLFFPGGFRQEFLALRLPRVLILPVVACGVLLAAGQAAPGSLALEVLIMVVFLYVFQGVAAVHRLVAAGKLAGAWLIGMYALLIILPQAVLFVACLGMVDSWVYPKAAPDTHDKS